MEMSYRFCRPYINNCHYCYVKYDVIGHLEDSMEDTMYIAMKQNLTTLLPELIKKNHKTKRLQSPQEDRIRHYMSQLNISQKRKLYELYQLDFELFGYDPGDSVCKNEACIEWCHNDPACYRVIVPQDISLIAGFVI